MADIAQVKRQKVMAMEQQRHAQQMKSLKEKHYDQYQKLSDKQDKELKKNMKLKLIKNKWN